MPNTAIPIIAIKNLNLRLTRNWKRDLNRFIDTVRFLCHIISEAFIGPGPTASTDLSELASATFSLVVIGISKIPEDLGTVPDLVKGFFS